MIVLDCSAAVDIVNETPRGIGLKALIDPSEPIIGPEWFRVEVRNAFWKYIHAGLMTEEEAATRIDQAESLITDYVPCDPYLIEAFAEAVNYDHSVYDMLYLCLTRRNAATLFTLDRKLVDVCIEARVNCVEEVDF